MLDSMEKASVYGINNAIFVKIYTYLLKYLYYKINSFPMEWSRHV